MVGQHTPVLSKEVIDLLQLKSDNDFIDATLGFGGHAAEVLGETTPRGRMLGVELDWETADAARAALARFGDRVQVVVGNYRDLDRIARKSGWERTQGILFDLGFSSATLKRGRGFSFMGDEALDMRYGEGELTAAHIINSWTVDELERIFREFGDEDRARSIAHGIIKARKAGRILTTGALVGVIASTYGGRSRRIHPATKVFQALRIAVNDEFGNLRTALPKAVSLLAPGGRIAVISFHSGEDRIVKNFFRDEDHAGRLRILTKRPVVPGAEEIMMNPRARSAKLRVAEKRTVMAG